MPLACAVVCVSAAAAIAVDFWHFHFIQDGKDKMSIADVCKIEVHI